MHAQISILIICTFFPLINSQFIKEKHSLTGPFEGGILNDWQIAGGAEVTTNYVSLTPEMIHRQGSIWNIHPFFNPDWEIQIQFGISGTQAKYGNGIAIWYAKEPLHLGPVFGSKDYFSGLGIFLDTFQDESAAHKHQHPYISAMVNNGSSKYHHDEDGTYTEVGGCYAELRNKNYITRIAVAYIENTLSVFTDTDGNGLWQSCFTVPGIHLPTGYYFGVSASTDDQVDHHQVFSITGMEYDIGRQDVAHLAHVIPYAEFHKAPKEYVQSQQQLDELFAETLLEMQKLEKEAEKIIHQAEAEKIEMKKTETKKSVKEEKKPKREKVVKMDTSSTTKEDSTDSTSSLLRKSIYIIGTIIIVVIAISTCRKYSAQRKESMHKRLY